MALASTARLVFRDPGAAQAGGYTLALAGLLVAIGLVFHPLPAGGFAERQSILQNTPWWGLIHAVIAAGFVLVALGSVLVLVGGGIVTAAWTSAFCWGAMSIGMIFFTGTALTENVAARRLFLRLSPYSEIRVEGATYELSAELGAAAPAALAA